MSKTFKVIFFILSISTSLKAETLMSEILQISDDPYVKSSVFVADKSKRQLYYFSNSENLNQYDIFEIDIGKNDGNKMKRDDQKTPEGIYFLQQKLTPPEIPFDLYGSMAFTTNYPNVFDKFENKTGSGIWLHSVPDTIPLNRGSRGCVVLRNDKIKMLSSQITLNKSFIIINDQVHWLSANEHNEEKQKVSNWLRNWKDLWSNQDYDKYIRLYSDEFSAPGFNKETWLRHKEKLKKIYTNIDIQISEPSIFHIKNQYIIRFVQSYKSNNHEDKGLKTLYLIAESKNKSDPEGPTEQIKVLREEWSPI